MTIKRRDERKELSLTAGQTQVTVPKSVEESETADAAAVSLSRRAFLSSAAVSTAAAATAMSATSLLSTRARAIVKAATYYNDPAKLLEASEELGEAMRGLDVAKLPQEELLQTRGW